MTQTFSFFDSALLTATIETTGEVFDHKDRKDELLDLYRECRIQGVITCDGFTINRTIDPDTYNVSYLVTYTA